MRGAPRSASSLSTCSAPAANVGEISGSALTNSDSPWRPSLGSDVCCCTKGRLSPQPERRVLDVEGWKPPFPGAVLPWVRYTFEGSKGLISRAFPTAEWPKSLSVNRRLSVRSNRRNALGMKLEGYARWGVLLPWECFDSRLGNDIPPSFLRDREVASAGIRWVLIDSSNDLGRILLTRAPSSASGGPKAGDAWGASWVADKGEEWPPSSSCFSLQISERSEGSGCFEGSTADLSLRGLSPTCSWVFGYGHGDGPPELSMDILF